MNRLALALIATTTLAVPVLAAPGGPIGTLPLGHYVCELPGDVTGLASLRQPEVEFTLTRGSSYQAAGGAGTYLLTGDRLTFTAGPRQGATYRRTGTSFLRQLQADGTDGRLRCVRQSSAENPAGR